MDVMLDGELDSLLDDLIDADDVSSLLSDLNDDKPISEEDNVNVETNQVKEIQPIEPVATGPIDKQNSSSNKKIKRYAYYTEIQGKTYLCTQGSNILKLVE